MSRSTAPRLAQPGIYRGFVLQTPLGHLTGAQQSRLVQTLLAQASRQTAHQVRLVLEGRAGIDALTPSALAELRKLTAQALA